MPNHTTNLIRFSSHDRTVLDRIADLLALTSTDEHGESYTRVIDFNRLIPMPENTKSRTDINHIDFLLDWSRNHWGTKWNAYDIGEWQHDEITDHDAHFDGACDIMGEAPPLYLAQIEFDTAWCSPTPVIDKLVLLAQDNDARFDYWYSDEDGGSTYDPVFKTRIKLWTHAIVSKTYWE